MSPELPEDPSDWPDDPFAVLGLERGAAAVEIKRAYTRLIKRFKPEHNPEAFRRVRDAYEQATSQSRWILDYLPEPAPQAESALPPLAATRGDEAARLWSLAVDGRCEEAYHPLVRLAEQEAERPDLPLRLYWLLSLEPQLDADRSRHHWLGEALKRSRLSGSAAELYRRELRIDAETALYERAYSGLLAAAASPMDKLSLARNRLAAAGRSQSWSMIVDDVRELARCLPMADEAAWLAFLCAANDWSVWDRPDPLYSVIRDELDKLQHLELPQAHWFDRMEEARRSSKGWAKHASGFLSPPWMRLVPAAWADGSAELGEVSRAVREVDENPMAALERFDRLQHEFGPFILFALARLLDRLLSSRNTHAAHFPEDALRALAARLPGGWNRRYPDLRKDLLEFLVVQFIHPDEFVAACGVDPHESVRESAAALGGDLSLKLVWLAWSLAAGCGS